MRKAKQKNRVKAPLQGGQDCYHIVMFFRGPMFELQPCHYYEGFSHCFTYYGRYPKKSNAKETILLYFI